MLSLSKHGAGFFSRAHASPDDNDRRRDTQAAVASGLTRAQN